MNGSLQRLVVTGLIAIALLSVVSCVILTVMGHDHVAGLCQLAATCAGVLGGLAWPVGRDRGHT